MSEEHARAFESSIQKSTFWIYKQPDVSWLKYDCGYVHVYTLEIVFIDINNLYGVSTFSGEPCYIHLVEWSLHPLWYPCWNATQTSHHLHAQSI